MAFANFLFDTGRFKESLDAIEPAWRFGLTGDTSMGTAVPIMVAAHGRALIALGRIKDGLVDIERAQELASRMPDVPDLTVPLWSFRARGLLDLGRLDAARDAIQHARDIAGKGPPSLQRFVAAARRRLLVAQGDGAQALAEFSSLRAAQKLPALPTAREKPSAMAEAAWLALAAGDAGTAEVQARQALGAIDAGKSADYQRDHEALATLVLGQALLRQQRAAQARPVLERAVALHRAEYDDKLSLALAEALSALADARRALGESGSEERAQADRIRAAQTMSNRNAGRGAASSGA